MAAGAIFGVLQGTLYVVSGATVGAILALMLFGQDLSVIGLIGIILVKILAPGFYARQDIKTPVKIAIVTLLATQAMNVLFAFGLHLNHAGLALSIGLAACFNSAVLFYLLRKRGIYRPEPGWGIFLVKLAVAMLALGIAFITATGILLAQELNNQMYFWAIPVVSVIVGLFTVMFIYRELRRKAYERA